MKEYVDLRTRIVEASTEEVFAVVCMIGGKVGWFSPRFLWRLRGWLDRLGGGPGPTPRRHPADLELGDPIDFWRVAAIETPHRLRLLTEMTQPGVGILEFEVTAIAPGADACRLSQTATFAPSGALGHIYWFALTPIHNYIFRRMIDGIARTAESTRVSSRGNASA